MKQPLGIRNNNPLNIRRSESHQACLNGRVSTDEDKVNIRRGKTQWKGEISASQGTFCKFESMEWGLRAAFCLLRTYATKYRLCCVRDIISRWAPPKENDTASYIRHVCQLTGFGGNQRLTEKDWPRLVKAMARIECGVDLEDDIIQKGFQLYRQK